MMDGRWWVRWNMNYEGVVSSRVDGPRPQWVEGPSSETWGTAAVAVPVVPCDDAAVARAVAMIEALPAADEGRTWREIVEIAFHAAADAP